MPPTTSLRLTAEDSLLLVIDFQEKLVPHIAHHEQVVDAAARMIRAAGVLNLPIVTTEQYSKGLGLTVPGIREAYPPDGFRPIEKITFGCGGCEEFVAAIGASNRSRIVVVGIEAHVCVQQTVLDLLALGYVPFVCADGIGSRRDLDRDIAIERMRQAGAVITTTESAIFELLHRAGTEEFKKMLRIVK